MKVSRPKVLGNCLPFISTYNSAQTLFKASELPLTRLQSLAPPKSVKLALKNVPSARTIGKLPTL